MHTSSASEKIRVSIKLPAAVRAGLKAASDREGITQSDFVRRYVGAVLPLDDGKVIKLPCRPTLIE